MSAITGLLSLTANIVNAHVANNEVTIADLPELIGCVHASLASLAVRETPVPIEQQPAVAIRTSISPAFIICLEDGKKMKLLKQHLMTSYGLTPDAYRRKWKLPADYPMVAPDFAAHRRAYALKVGLGNKRLVGTPPQRPAPAKRHRGETVRVPEFPAVVAFHPATARIG